MAAPPVRDSDYETDEECLVHVSVSGILQEDPALLPRDHFQFFDLQSDRPLVTIGGQAFVGTYEDTVGSSVFFQRVPGATVRDAVFGRQPQDQVRYHATTRKKLHLKRVFLNRKPEAKKDSKTPSGEQQQPPPAEQS